MRTIPSELLGRVKKKWQVPAENADPKMKVYLSRGFLNELFQVFTIQEGAALTDVDVTVKRTETASDPAEAFALAVNNGVAEVKSKALPYDDQFPWVYRFTVASGVSAVAIEFDGYWDRDFATRRFNFVTESEPWLFYVVGGSLYAKYWLDAPFVLATGVIKVAAIRGWLPANGDQSNDQGLIVAYLKTDGTMWYRAYCIQGDLTKLWEVERQVTAFAGVITNLALFRTNDFRVGFVAEIAGETWWTLSTRNYAGMSVWPERITAAIKDLVFEVTPIKFSDMNEPIEHITAGVDSIVLLACRPIYPTLVSISNLANDYNLKVTFSHAISGSAVGHQGKFTLTDANAVNFAINATSAGANSAELMLSCANFASAKNPMTLTHLGGLTCNNDGCEFDVPIGSTSFTANIEPPKGYATEYITAIIQPTFVVSQIYYRSAYTDERITASVSAISFVVTKVGANPL